MIQDDARHQLHVRAEQAMMAAGRLLLQSIALLEMIEAELARPAPQAAPSMQRPIAARSVADLRRKLEAAVAERFRQQGGASRQHDQEIHRAADEATTRARDCPVSSAGHDHMTRVYLRGRRTDF